MYKALSRLLLSLSLVLSSPGWHALAMEYIPSSVPEFYFVGQSGQQVIYLRHVFDSTGKPFTQYVKVDYSQGPIPGVTVDGVAVTDVYAWNQVGELQPGHIAPEGDAALYDYNPAEPGKGEGVMPGDGEGNGQGQGSGTLTGIDPGYAMVGQFVIGMIRMNGNPNFLVAGVSTSAAQKMAENIQAVASGIGRLHYVSSRLDSSAATKAGTLVPLPKNFAGEIQGIDGPMAKVTWPYDPITYSEALVVTDPGKVKDLVKDVIGRGNPAELMKNSDLISNLGKYPEITEELGGSVKDGVLQVSDPKGQPGPFNEVKFETPGSSPLGRAIRRAANKNQVAWQSGAGSVQATADTIEMNKLLLGIADQRLANAKYFNSDQLKQAEGLIYAAEKTAEFVSGYGDGFTESVLNMAETIYAIPDIGEQLYDYMKAAYQNPNAALSKAADVLSKTPEFLTGLYEKALNALEKLPDMSAAEVGKWLGEMSTEVVAAMATGGVAGAGMKAAKAARMGSALAKTRQVAGKVKQKLKDVSEHFRKRTDFKDALGAPADFPGDFPGLEDFYKPTFGAGKYSPATALPGRNILLQSRNIKDTHIGDFFFLRESRIPRTTIEADRKLNIFKYGNRSELIRGYKLKKPLPGYYGPVKGAKGYQFVVPKTIDQADYLEEIFVIRLGQ